jgi:hypothetical protein
MSTTGLEHPAVFGPEQTLRRLLAEVPGADQGLGAWRWQVRRQLAPLFDAVARPGGPTGDGLAARSGGCVREQAALGRRIAALAPRVVGDTDVARLCHELRLLLDDVRRHEQRCHDLAYDEVEMELGGSE